jgi:hypothetical protein
MQGESPEEGAATKGAVDELFREQKIRIERFKRLLERLQELHQELAKERVRAQQVRFENPKLILAETIVEVLRVRRRALAEHLDPNSTKTHAMLEKLDTEIENREQEIKRLREELKKTEDEPVRHRRDHEQEIEREIERVLDEMRMLIPPRRPQGKFRLLGSNGATG